MDSDHFDATHGKIQAYVKLRLVMDGFSESDLIIDSELQTGTQLLKACKMEDEYPDSRENMFGLFASLLDCAIQGLMQTPDLILSFERSCCSVSVDTRSQTNIRHQVVEDKLMLQKVKLLLDKTATWSLLWQLCGKDPPEDLLAVQGLCMDTCLLLKKCPSDIKTVHPLDSDAPTLEPAQQLPDGQKIAEQNGGKFNAGVYATRCNNVKHILPICDVHGLMPIPDLILRSEISWRSVSKDIRSQSNKRRRVLEDKLMQQKVQLLLEESSTGSLMWHGKGPAVPPKMKGGKDKGNSKEEPPKKGTKGKGNSKGVVPSKKKGEVEEKQKDKQPEEEEEEKEYRSFDDLKDLNLPYEQVDWTGETDKKPPKQQPHLPRLIKDQRDKCNIITEIITSPVRDQGKKRICWAISVASAVEAVMNLHRAEDDNTQWMASSQELMDWVQLDEDKVANRGLQRMHEVWDHVLKKKVSKEENYKYEGIPALEKERPARGETVPGRVVLRISGFDVKEPVKESLLLRQLAKMPVVASLEATPSFLAWKGRSIFNGEIETEDDRKARRENKIELHSVLVVGYGKTENGANYFLIRNSYGRDWGFKIRGADGRCEAKGLGRILRASSRSNGLSVFTSFSYPEPWVPF